MSRPKIFCVDVVTRQDFVQVDALDFIKAGCSAWTFSALRSRGHSAKVDQIGIPTLFRLMVLIFFLFLFYE
jgi:hypothetical protein